jgi:hypothetical protein
VDEFRPDAPLEEWPEELRALLVDDAEGLRRRFDDEQARWGETVERARALPEARLHESVDGEWSFLRTLRHVIYATDTWIGRMVFAETAPFHPWGQPFDELGDATPDGLDLAAEPGLEAVLEALDTRVVRVRQLLAGLTDADLDRECAPPDATTHPDEPHALKVCIWTVLEEGWWHRRFADRDLAALASDAPRPPTP